MSERATNIFARNSFALKAAGIVCFTPVITIIFLSLFFLTSQTYGANRTWNGASSSVWTLAANWVGGNVPGNGDNVLIPGGLTNYPIVTTTVNIKNLTVNSSGTGALLTITTGNLDASKVNVELSGTLIVSGGTFSSTGITVNGTLGISSGFMYHSGTLLVTATGTVNQSAGIIHMNGNATAVPKDNLQIDAGGVFNQTGGTLALKDLLTGAGTFNQNGSSAIFRLERNWQMGAGSTFNATSGTVQFSGNSTSSNFAAGNRQFANVVVNATINPGFSTTAGSTIPIRGNFTNNNTALANTTNVTFIFNGSGNQNVTSTTTAAVAVFGNVQVNKTGGVVSWQSNCSLSGNFTLTAGTLDFITFTANRTTLGGSFTADPGSSILLRGSNGGQPGSNFPLNFSAVSLAATSTVVFNGTNQTVPAYTFGNLTLSSSSGAAVKTMPATAITVAGNLTSQQGSGTSVSYTAGNAISIGGNLSVGAGTTFTTGAYTHTLGGNLTNSGTMNSTGSRLVFNGTAIQTVQTAGALNRVIVNKPSGMVSLASDLTINDSLVFTQRIIRTGSFRIISVSGVVSNSAQSTGWVYGRLQKSVAAGSNITRSFEIGDSLVYAPVSVQLGTVSVAGTVIVQTIGTDHPLIGSSLITQTRSVNRYWNFVNSGITFSNGTFTFNWASTDIDVPSSPEFYKVGRYTTIWDTLPSLLSGAYSIQASGIGAFGSFIVGEVCDNTVTGTWTGNVNSDWFVTENWRCGILPGTSTDIKIPTGLAQYPVVGSGIASARNILIQPGASLSINNSTIRISGSITNNGSLNASTGGIEFNGTTSQVLVASLLTGNAIENLTANNAAGVTVSGTLSVSGKLKVSQGTLVTGGALTLIASATKTALIDGSGSGTLSGIITMQRYLPAGFGYKYISSPFQSATVSELADEIDLSATFPTLYRYDELQDATGWVEYTSGSNSLNPLSGYAANFGNIGSPVTMDISGTVSSGNQSVSLFNNNKPFTLGFNLVGNPYPSPVNWDYLPGWSRVNIDDAIYFFDASSSDMYGGVYSSYINGISSNGIANNIIPSMQGFFVHVTDGSYPVSATFGINNAARTTDLQPVFHKIQNETRPLIRLGAQFSDNNSSSDVLVIYFEDMAADGYEKDKDALKLMNTDESVPSLYALTPGNEKLSINALPATEEYNVEIPLGIKSAKAGTVLISLKELARIPSNINVYLSDVTRRVNHDLRTADAVSVSLEEGNHTNRFYLKFTDKILPYVSDIDEFGVHASGETISLYVNVYPGETGNVEISNLQGQVQFNKQFTSGNYTITSTFSSGIYIVSFRSGTVAFSKKLFLQNE